MNLAFNIKDVFSPASIYSGTDAEVTGVAKLVGDILMILTSFAGVIAIIFIIIAGVKFVTSSGDEKKLASASATLTYAIIGLAVVILSFIIIRVVQFFFGSNIPVT